MPPWEYGVMRGDELLIATITLSGAVKFLKSFMNEAQFPAAVIMQEVQRAQEL